MKLNKVVQNILYNWPVKVLCLVCAMGIYLVVQYSSLSTRVLDIPLQFTPPENYVVNSLVPQTIEVRITGPDESIYRILPDRITASVDFSFVAKVGLSTALVMVDYQSVLEEIPGISITTKPASITVDFASPSLTGLEQR